MVDDIQERLERLFKEGKITKEEKDKLLSLLTEQEQVSCRSVCEIELENLSLSSLQIQGVEGLTNVRVVDGGENISIKNVLEKLIISSKLTEVGVGIFKIRNERKLFLQVPKALKNFKIKLVSSEILIENIESNLNISVVSGDISLKDIKGDVFTSTVSGDVDYEGGKGDMNITTKSGDISVKNFSGSLKLKAYSGDISIENSILEEINVSSYSGDVDISSGEITGTSYINSFFGDVSVDVDPGKVKVFADTLSGDISAEGVQEHKNGNIFYGNGTIEVFVKSKSGDVSIKALKGGKNEG